jgi:queuine/archaeosine tRNA-ribosyltransferase
MKRIADLDLPGYAIGGLAVGERVWWSAQIHDLGWPYAD